MGPTESLIQISEGFYKEMKRSGITPFDTLSWAALKNLWTVLVISGRRGQYDDGEVHQKTQDMVWAAMERKAEAYQMERDDEAYYEELQELERI